MDGTEKYILTEMIADKHFVTDNGLSYKIPYGIDANEFYAIVKEYVELAKVKGLTTRQAQILFHVCSEYVLDRKFI